MTHVKECIPDVSGVDTLCGRSLAALGDGHSAIAGILTDAQITCPECRSKLNQGPSVGPTWTNPCLTSIFVKHLSGWFFQMKDGKNIPRFICDPWWWPRGPGRHKKDWGIPRCDRFVLRSLEGHLMSSDFCLNDSRKPPDGHQYEGFLGSVRALPGCPILVSIRPSVASFQVSFSLSHLDYRLPCDQSPSDSPKRLVPIHFTDIAKFRQRFSRDDPEADMDPSRWHVSVECLADEFDYLLQEGATQIIVVDLAKRLFRKGAALNKMGELRANWRSTPKDLRLDAALDIVEQALEIPGHRVCHWQTMPRFKAEMTRALSLTPSHSAAMYPI